MFNRAAADPVRRLDRAAVARFVSPGGRRPAGGA